MHLFKRVGERLDPYLILLLVLSGLALTPLFAPGYFYTAHDGRHSVFYLNMFDASIRDGALWPRWAMHHIQGYGYPTFIIQSPLGFYVAEIFMLLGAGATLAAKLTWAVAFLGSAWGMYRLTVHWLGTEDDESSGIDRARLAGLVAGLLYVYIPYHLAGIYVRGALNDTLLLAWYPWVFLAFDRLIAQGGVPWVAAPSGCRHSAAGLHAADPYILADLVFTAAGDLCSLPAGSQVVAGTRPFARLTTTRFRRVPCVRCLERR